jgi:hypothetical protein
MLRVNAAVNALDNMQFNALALWDHGGRASGADPSARATLDGYGRQQKIERIGLVMLDIGGAELAALRGAERYLGQPRERAPHLIFEVHRQHVDWSRGLDNTEICQYLGGFGYHLFAVRDYESNVPMGQQPIELVRPEETYLEGPPHGFNMLAVKEVAILANPAFRFVSGVSPKLMKHRDPKLHQPLAGAA